jgi:phosphoenolpyruvate---glycerone phosphotransferase subunit DhaL
MELGTALQRKLIETMARRVVAHADELTELDRAIGDADHGVNLKRGFEAVLAELDGLAAAPLGEALHKMGTTLVMKIGGASGPLYGTLLMTLGKNLRGTEPLTRERLYVAAEAAVAATKDRGKAAPGQKTMIDVLVPVLEELRAEGEGLPQRVRARAAAAAEATIPLVATRGRASFLGARSAGHMDPGARSCQILVGAVCDCLEEET